MPWLASMPIFPPPCLPELTSRLAPLRMHGRLGASTIPPIYRTPPLSSHASESECQSVCQSECQSDCQSECQSVCQSECQPVCQSECQSECQSVCQLVCLLACLLECQLVQGGAGMQ
ncbi:proline-rich protein 9-like [Salmo trutta]|uniref:proline-rich protein 9-like n=1 Tax=Salmo trutta TaxID=8032 RepID=UPI001131F75E|nr:proline-rich protein 9 [Salmo trutta]